MIRRKLATDKRLRVISELLICAITFPKLKLGREARFIPNLRAGKLTQIHESEVDRRKFLRGDTIGT